MTVETLPALPARLTIEWERAARRRPRLTAVAVALSLRAVPALLMIAALMGGVLGPLAAEGDASLFGQAADALWTGGRWNVFEDPVLQVGPLYLLPLAVARALCRFIGVPPSVGASAALAACAMWLLLLVLRRSGASRSAVWLVGGSFALAGPLAELLLNGHVEEVVAALLLVLAGQSALTGRPLAAGLLVGMATATKLWAVIGVFVFCLAARRCQRAETGGLVACAPSLLAGLGVAASVALGAYAPFVAWGDVRTLELVWSTDPASGLALLTGWSGPVPFGLRAVQAMIACGAAAALAWWRPEPARVVAVGVAARLLFDPLRQSYYWAALIVLLLLWCGMSLPHSRRVTLFVLVGPPTLVLLPYLLTEKAAGWIHLITLFVVLAVAARLTGLRTR